MPLVRIDLNKSYKPDDCKKIGDFVYRAMEEAISVPKDDKFQIITRHETSELNIPFYHISSKCKMWTEISDATEKMAHSVRFIFWIL